MSVQTELDMQTADQTVTSMYAVVKSKEGDDQWKEVADVISVSATGAGFYLQRECPVGSLLSIMLPLPENLRCYDRDKELYRVWGLVQHCHLSSEEDPVSFHIGVAFIGKNPPDSYNDNPLQTYRICGMNSDGLWQVSEAKTPFKTRKYPRFRKSIEHYLSILDSKQRTVRGERTVTENISKSGAAVYTTLDVEVGARVKFICEQYDFSGLAVVCNRYKTPDNRIRLHLQFTDNLFPIERVNLPESDMEEVVEA